MNSTDASLQQQLDDEETRAINREDDLQLQINGKEDTLGFTPEDSANKGQPNGYASLDQNGKVPTSELPNSVFGGITYQGSWDAVNNTPTLQSGVGTRGEYYKVNNASNNTTLNTNLDGVTDWTEGDLVLFNGSYWEKFDQTDKVSSVRGTNNTLGKVGDVVLSLQDVGASSYGADFATAVDSADGRSKLNLGTASTYDTGTAQGQIPVRVVNGDLTGNLLGNANTASELETARNLNFLGDVTGTGLFKGDTDLNITLTIEDDSHNHVISNVDGLQDALDDKLDATATAPNADTLDNISSEQFFRSDVPDELTYTGLGLGTGIKFEANTDVSTTHSGLVIKAAANPSIGDRILTVKSAGDSPRLIVEHDGAVKTSNSDMYVSVGVDGSGGNRVFHEAYHPNADALTNSITLSLSGDVSGTATTDWSGDVDIAVEVADNSHNHLWSNITDKPDPTITLDGDVSGSVTLTDLTSGTLTVDIDNSYNLLVVPNGGSYPTPGSIPASVSGIDAYSSPDNPGGTNFWTGITVLNNASTSGNGFQMVAYWNNELNAPQERMAVRTKDDTQTLFGEWRELAWYDEVRNASYEYKSEEVIASSSTVVISKTDIFGSDDLTSLGIDLRDIKIDVKVLDNTSGSPTNGMWIDASAVATYGINTTNQTVTVINEYTNSLTFYIRITL